MTQAQRQAIARELAIARLAEQGIDPALAQLSPYGRPEPKGDSFNDSARTANTLAELGKTQQQTAQAYAEAPSEIATKNSKALNDTFEIMASDDPRVMAQRFMEENGMNPYQATKMATLGSKYSEQNNPLIGGGKLHPDEVRNAGIALSESAKALGVGEETLLKNAGSNWFGQDGGNKNTDLLRSIGQAAASQNMGSAKNFADTSMLSGWFDGNDNLGPLNDDVIKSYSNALGKDFNAVRAARTMRAASDPAVVTPYLKQWGDAYGIQNPTWEMYRDAMNNSKNSSQLWTQYLMEVDKYVNQRPAAK